MAESNCGEAHAVIVAEHISIILTVTGVVTAAVVLQFFFPKPVLQLLSKLAIEDEAGLFFARHWGLLAFVIGGLLAYAADHAEARCVLIYAAYLLG